MDSVAAHATGHRLRQTHSPQVAPDDTRHPSGREPHTDAGAGGHGAQCRAALARFGAVDDGETRRHAAPASRTCDASHALYRHHETHHGVCLWTGLSTGFRLGRHRSKERHHHLRRDDLVPAAGRLDTAPDTATAEHGARGHTCHGQHRPSGRTKPSDNDRPGIQATGKSHRPEPSVPLREHLLRSRQLPLYRWQPRGDQQLHPPLPPRLQDRHHRPDAYPRSQHPSLSPPCL